MTERNNQTDYSLNWRNLKTDWPLWLLIAGMFIATAVLYSRLPEQIPTHWSISGEANAYTAKPWGAYMAPVVATGIYIMLLLMPHIDPRRANYFRFPGAYRAFRFILVLFFAGLHAISLSTALAAPLPMQRVSLCGMGLLFMLLGNNMGKIRPNYFIGIRTPWTLASDTVWQSTHRLAGRLWVGGGLVAVLAAFLLPTPANAIIGIGAIGVGSVWSVVHSYLAWRRTVR